MSVDLKPGSRWLLPVTIYDVVGFGERPPHRVTLTTDGDDYISLFNPDIETLIPADRITKLEAEVAGLRGWLRDLAPHLDALICYASSMDEHRPNRIAPEILEYLIAHPPGVAHD